MAQLEREYVGDAHGDRGEWGCGPEQEAQLEREKGTLVEETLVEME